MIEKNIMKTDKENARKHLVLTAQAMLSGEKSFFEGAKVVCELRPLISNVTNTDSDFNIFMTIYSETDHLPYESQRHLWSADALQKLELEFQKTEIWAASFASDACKNLMTRFGTP